MSRLHQDDGGERVDFEDSDAQRLERTLHTAEPLMWAVIAASVLAIVVGLAKVVASWTK